DNLNYFSSWSTFTPYKELHHTRSPVRRPGTVTERPSTLDHSDGNWVTVRRKLKVRNVKVHGHGNQSLKVKCFPYARMFVIAVHQTHQLQKLKLSVPRLYAYYQEATLTQATCHQLYRTIIIYSLSCNPNYPK
ncbi:hypothetical protein Z043_119022, partial [Scleropages formosus]